MGVEWVELGRIGAPYGVRGWVHVHSYTDPPEGLLGFRRWSVQASRGERRDCELLDGRPQGRGLVVKLAGVDDREQAVALRGGSVQVQRAQLPPTREREFYQADLIGLAVRNVQGLELGRVAHFVDAPGGAVMVVQGAQEHWIPAIPQHLRRVDVAGGCVTVDWPATLE